MRHNLLLLLCCTVAIIETVVAYAVEDGGVKLDLVQGVEDDDMAIEINLPFQCARGDGWGCWENRKIRDMICSRLNWESYCWYGFPGPSCYCCGHKDPPIQCYPGRDS